MISLDALDTFLNNFNIEITRTELWTMLRFDNEPTSFILIQENHILFSEMNFDEKITFSNETLKAFSFIASWEYPRMKISFKTNQNIFDFGDDLCFYASIDLDSGQEKNQLPAEDYDHNLIASILFNNILTFIHQEQESMKKNKTRNHAQF